MALYSIDRMVRDGLFAITVCRMAFAQTVCSAFAARATSQRKLRSCPLPAQIRLDRFLIIIISILLIDSRHGPPIRSVPFDLRFWLIQSRTFLSSRDVRMRTAFLTQSGSFVVIFRTDRRVLEKKKFRSLRVCW